MASPLGRNYMLVLTEEFVTSLDDLVAKVQAIQENLTDWGVITHDLDAGTNHYHIALKFKNPIRLSTVAILMQQPENLVQLWRRNEGNMWAYMTHQTTQAKANKADYLPYLDDPQKSRWSSEETKDKARYKADKKQSENKAKLDKTIRQILLGETTVKDLLKPENIEYYHENYNKLTRAVQLRTQSLKYNPPRCTTIYIQGQSGTGKTNYATEIAKQMYPDSWAFASAGNDPLQDYTGEKCLILDDWRPTDYTLQDLLAMLDPNHRARTHRSRYYNKPLATEMIIITSNMTFADAVDYYTAYNSEDPVQLRRRVHKIITVHKDGKTDTDIYNEKLDGYTMH